MGPNKEIDASALHEHSESDEEFIQRLDDVFKQASRLYKTGHLQYILHDDHEFFKEQERLSTNIRIVDQETLERLNALKKSGTGLARPATMLYRYLKNNHNGAIIDSETNILASWRRQKAHYVQNISERVEDQRVIDKELGYIVLKYIELENTQNSDYIQGFPRSYDEDIGHAQLDRLIQLSDSLDTLALDPEILSEANRQLDVETEPPVALHYVIHALGFDDLYSRLDMRHAKNGSIDRCVPIDPPWTVAVVLHDSKGRTSYELSLPFHEVGHGLHFLAMSAELLSIERIQLSPWNEGMAFLLENMMSEPDVFFNKNDFDKLRQLQRSHIARRAGSIRSVLEHLSIQKILFESTDLTAMEEKLKTIHTAFHPSEIHDNPYWWAKDMYVVEYPFYGINYLYGWMIAAQIKDWWKKTHDEPLLSKAFGDFLREKCYASGNSVPWRQLLTKITGEDVNPQYLVDELSLVLKGSIDQ